MVPVSGFLTVALGAANGNEWTYEGPQNRPLILMEFWDISPFNPEPPFIALAPFLALVAILAIMWYTAN